MTESSKLRIAFIGCGGIAPSHANPLLADRRVRITHLVDPNPQKLARFKERLPALAGLPESVDYRPVLDAVDAVVISTPHTLHYPQVMAALDKGLHVLVEKPMTCTVAHARRVVRKVRSSRLKLQVAYQRKASPAFRYLHDQVASGAIGRLNYIAVLLAQEWLYGCKGSWRHDPKLSGGGQLNDSGSHLVNMLTWLPCQQPARVAAFSDNRGTKVDIDSAVSILYDKGALATLSVIASAHRWDERWFIVGSKATLTYDNGAVRRIDGLNAQPRDIVLPTKPADNITRNWIDAIFGKAKLLSPATCGLDVIRLTEAIWKSAAAGARPVRV